MTTDASILIKATDATKSAFASINGSMSKINGQLSKVKGAVFSVTGAVAALAGVGGFGLLIKSQLSAADAMGKTSDKLGIQTEKLAAFQHLGELSGVSTDKMTDSLEKMTRNLGEAVNGTGTATKALDHLGLSAQEIVKLSPDQQFQTIADSINQLSTQSEKAAAANQIFGRSGIDLLNVISAGSQGFKDAEAATIAYGTALSRIEAKKIENANDSFTRVGELISGVGRRIAAELAPYLEYAANWFLETAKQAGGVGTVVNSAMDGSVTAIGYVITALDYMQIGWEALRLGVITFATVSLKALDSIIDPIRYVNELLGVEQPEAFKFLTSLVGDFEQAAINSQAKLVGLVANVGQNAESAKGKLLDIKQTADEVAKIQVGAIATQTPEKAYEDMVAVKASEQQAINEAMALKWAAEENYRQQTLQAEQLLNQQKLDAVQGTFGALSTLMSAQSKKLFKLGKAAAIASALINTYEAITKTMASVPYPWNIPLAAAQGLAGMVQVQNIRAQQFTGARQFGGDVVGGTPYLVGERGPELFTPRTSGGITANKDMSAGNTNTINMTVMANDVKSFEDALDRSENKIWNQIIKRMNEEGMRFA